MNPTFFSMRIGMHLILVGLVSFYSSLSMSQSADSTESKTTAVITDAANTPIDNSESVQTRVSRWGLKAEEYARYQTLMRGPLGNWNPDIDPLLALGMFAETPAQEQYYAERYAQQEFELAQRAIHFQQTYRAAFRRLFSDATVIDQDLLQPYFQHRQAKLGVNRQSFDLQQRQFRNGDTLMYFAKHDCTRCNRELKQFIRLLSGLENAKVAVYVDGATNDETVQHWATVNRVEPQWLQESRLTLNRDEGLYQTLQSKAGTSTDTRLYLRRNNRFYQLSAMDLGL